MQIVPAQITIRALVEGYRDDPETRQVVGYRGKLDIRPAYQREFVYKNEQRDAVIRKPLPSKCNLLGENWRGYF